MVFLSPRVISWILHRYHDRPGERYWPQTLEARGIDVISVPRGGEVTFHGPGQLVAYPILSLKAAGLGARAYVESLEDGVIDALRTWGIDARGRVPGATGVWVGERKIAALGVKIAHGIWYG